MEPFNVKPYRYQNLYHLSLRSSLFLGELLDLALHRKRKPDILRITLLLHPRNHDHLRPLLVFDCFQLSFLIKLGLFLLSNENTNPITPDPQGQAIRESILKRPKSLTAKLKVCDPELRLYVIELEKENLKLHKEKAKLQVQIVSQQHEIEVLKKGKEMVNIELVKFGNHCD